LRSAAWRRAWRRPSGRPWEACSSLWRCAHPARSISYTDTHAYGHIRTYAYTHTHTHTQTHLFMLSLGNLLVALFLHHHHLRADHVCDLIDHGADLASLLRRRGWGELSA
jgi:hypothetical protein